MCLFSSAWHRNTFRCIFEKLSGPKKLKNIAFVRTSSLKRLFRLYRWSRRDPAGFHAHKDDVYLGPKDPDEEIPELHFPSLGPELTVLTQVTQMSRLKGELYRY